MKKGNKIKQKQKAPKKNMKKIAIAFIAGLIILIYFVYAIIQLIKQPTDVFMIENGSLSEEESAVGYIIREETVIQGNNYKNGMVEIKADGEKVAKGDAIYRYYSNNEEELEKKIQELDEKIQSALEDETDLYNSDMKLLENQIQEKLLEIADNKNLQTVEEYKKDISEKITKKAKIAGELSPSGSYLKKLIEERSSYENSLNSGAEYVTAPESGLVSYRVDGLESVLTPDSFSTLNKEFLENLNLKTGEVISKSTESAKIVNNFEGYIATSLDSEDAMNAEVGDSVKIRLSNSDEISATIEYIVEEEDSRLIIFKITNDLDLLSNYRKITFDVIWWSYSGLKVPNNALIKEQASEDTNIAGQDIYYIVRNRIGYTDKILVKVLKQNSSYSIITNYTTEELKEQFGTTSSSKTIVIHDEVVLNPKTKNS